MYIEKAHLRVQKNKKMNFDTLKWHLCYYLLKQIVLKG